MLTELFVSLRDLRLQKDDRLLRELAACSSVAGIEVSGGAFHSAPIRAAGLRLSVHNPLPWRYADLSDVFPTQWCEDGTLAGLVNAPDTPFVGFHLGYPKPEGLKDPTAVRQMAIENVGHLARLTDKTVLFETPSYFRRHRLTALADSFATVTSPGFVDELCRTGGCGFVFDAAHVLITGETVASERYVEEMVDAAGPHTRQLHISVPSRDATGDLRDAHGPLRTGRAETDLILAISRAVVRRAPSLMAVTLEIASAAGADSIEFGTQLVAQAALACKLLQPGHGGGS